MREGEKKHLRKKPLNLFLEKLIDRIKKTLDTFFFGNRQQSNARAGQKNNMIFWKFAA